MQGVTVEPYVVCRRADATTTCTAEDVPEEGLDSQSRFALRFRWYRSVVNRGGAVCWVHGDREATLQCVLCLRAKVDVRKSFHCSTDCLRRHWGLHKELHGQSNRFNGVHATTVMSARYPWLLRRPGYLAAAGCSDAPIWICPCCRRLHRQREWLPV